MYPIEFHFQLAVFFFYQVCLAIYFISTEKPVLKKGHTFSKSHIPFSVYKNGYLKTYIWVFHDCI